MPVVGEKAERHSTFKSKVYMEG